jgi:hypothetical protein
LYDLLKDPADNQNVEIVEDANEVLVQARDGKLYSINYLRQ